MAGGSGGFVRFPMLFEHKKWGLSDTRRLKQQHKQITKLVLGTTKRYKPYLLFCSIRVIKLTPTVLFTQRPYFKITPNFRQQRSEIETSQVWWIIFQAGELKVLSFQESEVLSKLDSGGFVRIRVVLSKPKSAFKLGFGWFRQDSGGSFKTQKCFQTWIRVVLSGFGWFFQVSEFFRTEKCFQTADSGLSLRIRGVLSSFGVLQNSKVLSNSGFGSFSQDSGCSFKILRVLQKCFQMDVDAFFDGWWVFF